MNRIIATDAQLLRSLDPAPKAPPPKEPQRVRARGPLTSSDYAAIREAQRKRTYVRYQEKLYRVEKLTRDKAAGTFEAVLQERRAR